MVSAGISVLGESAYRFLPCVHSRIIQQIFTYGPGAFQTSVFMLGLRVNEFECEPFKSRVCFLWPSSCPS